MSCQWMRGHHMVGSDGEQIHSRVQSQGQEAKTTYYSMTSPSTLEDIQRLEDHVSHECLAYSDSKLLEEVSRWF